MRSLRTIAGGAALRARLVFFTLLALVGAVGLTQSQTRAQTGPGGDRRAIVLTLDGAVSPASADYITRGIADAAAEGAALVVLRMDTPGGLDSSMRAIIREILASPVPVASYVAPSGARAASAGTYILYASHVAAMAPGTNLGAATPVAIGGGGSPFGDGSPFGGEEEEAPAPAEDAADEEAAEDEAPPRRFEPATASEAKVINDAVAYIRGLADLRGRNADWAERAVREAVSLTGSAALAENVIDLTATSLADLLAQADGRVVQVGETEVTLATEGLILEEREPGLRNQILSIITDPNVALLLMVFGFYGIVFELLNPGALVPGTIGAISLLTGFYALAVLPVTIAGAALMLLGLALLVAEAFAPSFGILGIGGAVALTLGATLLFDGDVPGMELSWPVIAAVGVMSLGFALLVARLAVTSHKERVSTGREEMIGSEAEVLDWSGESGAVHTHGERWRARAAVPLVPGDTVTVTAIDGLVLEVAPRAAAARAPETAARE
jgi:membrane-bound serine protease (ClpP class)